MNDNNITDVDFKEVPTNNEVSEDAFDPADYLISALQSAGHPDPAAWTKDMDPRARTAPEEKDRIFFANRAIRLYLAEHGERENITPRLLLAEGIGKVKWAALMEQGVVPWLMNKFDAKGKIIKDTPDVDAADLEGKEVTITANDGGPVANEDGSARQVVDFVLEPTYKENDASLAEDYLKVSNEPKVIAKVADVGAFVKLDDSFATDHAQVEAVLGDGSETHLWGNVHPNDMPVIMGVDTGTEVLPPADDSADKEFTPGDDEPLCCNKPTACDHLNIPCSDRIEADQVKVRGEVKGLIATDEFGKPMGTDSLTKLDIDPKYLDVK